MDYTAPTPEDLRKMKKDLGYTGEQMAELFGLSGGQQWRKYTGGAEPREMSAQMLFFGVARLTLTADDLDQITSRMRAAGATIDLKKECE